MSFSIPYSPTLTNLRRSTEASNIVYKHWFQNQMGNSLIKDGMCLAQAKTKNERCGRLDHQFWSNRDCQMSQTSLSQSGSRRTTTSSVSTAIYFCSPSMSGSFKLSHAGASQVGHTSVNDPADLKRKYVPSRLPLSPPSHHPYPLHLHMVSQTSSCHPNHPVSYTHLTLPTNSLV